MAHDFKQFRPIPGQGNWILIGNQSFESFEHDSVFPFDLGMVKLTSGAIRAVSLFPVSIAFHFSIVFLDWLDKFFSAMGKFAFPAVVAIS